MTPNAGGYLRCTQDGERQYQHIRIAEKAIGRALPSGAEVHHVDENPGNNSPDNLVVCPSRAYHKLLHYRTKALAACGNANWCKCYFCREYDDPANLRGRVWAYDKYGVVTRYWHTHCQTDFNAAKYAKAAK